MRNDNLYDRAFVLELQPGADVASGRVEGRLEHLGSTRCCRFSSLEEMIAALQSLLEGGGQPAIVADEFLTQEPAGTWAVCRDDSLPDQPIESDSP